MAQYLIVAATAENTNAPEGATLAFPQVGEMSIEKAHGYTFLKVENKIPGGDDHRVNLDFARPVEVKSGRYEGECDRVFHWGCAGVLGATTVAEATTDPTKF